MRLFILVKPGSKLGPKIVQNIPEQPVSLLSTSNSHSGQCQDLSITPEYTVYLRAKPHDGEANAALLTLLSKHFKVPKTQIKIVSGATSRRKVVDL